MKLETTERNEYIRFLNEADTIRQHAINAIRKCHNTNCKILIPNIVLTIKHQNYEFEKEFQQKGILYYSESVLGYALRNFFINELNEYFKILNKVAFYESFSPKCIYYNFMRQIHTNPALDKIYIQEKIIQNFNMDNYIFDLLKDAYPADLEVDELYNQTLKELDQLGRNSAITKFLSDILNNQDNMDSPKKVKKYGNF